MAASMSKLPTRTASRATTPPSEMSATSEVPPPMSTTMFPSGSLMGSPAPMAAAMGCSMRWASAAPARRAASVTARFSTAVMADGHADDHPRPVEAVHADPLQQQPDHALGDLEVGDGALAQRPDRDDVARGAPDHLPGLVAHGQHVLGPAVERDHGGLVQDDALTAHVHERVRRAEIDGEVARQLLPSRVRSSSSGGRRAGPAEGRPPEPVPGGPADRRPRPDRRPSPASASISRWNSSTLDMKWVGLR